MHTGEHKSVTIGIATFNRAGVLQVALESASRQSYPGLKIVVSDNASPGTETRRVVESAQLADPRVEYRAHPTNIGAYANFLSLVDAADSDLFMWLADDDELVGAGFVDSLVRCFEDDASARMVFPDVDVFFDESRSSWARNLMTAHFADCRTDGDYLEAWCKFGGGYPAYGLFDLAFLRALNPTRTFAPTLAYYGEGIFLHRAFASGGIRFCPDAKIVFNGLNSGTEVPSRKMLASFVRYSASVHAFHLARRTDVATKVRLLGLIAKSHVPYARRLVGKAMRNEMGG